MSLKPETVKGYLDRIGVRYMEVSSGDPAVLLAHMAGEHGAYTTSIQIEEEGTFVQFRAPKLAVCRKSHANIDTVLQVLGAINYRYRFLKLGWDPSDGEIAGYGDMWLMDGTVTFDQFHRSFFGFLSALDDAYRRVQMAIFTGKDADDESGI